jgi:transcriptional regulator with XRE-family HTH domain
LPTISGAPVPETRTLEEAIGIQIRSCRKHHGLTVAKVARAAGISSGMLSKIENGQISPSLGTLQILAKALSLPLSSLFATFEEKRDCSYVARGHGLAIDRRGTKVGHQYELLGHSFASDIVVEPYLITLTKDASAYTAFQHEGVELIHLLSGEVVYAHADRSYHLKPGDTLLFDSSAAHGPKTLISAPIVYLDVIAYLRK